MLNWIWLGLILAGTAILAVTGKVQPAVDGAIGSAEKAVTTAIGLIGIMVMWLGLMRLAEAAGLVQAVARLLRPILSKLFPDVPPDHPAMGSMFLNLAANALGLTNAATPLGLRAMRDLESLNRRPGTATDAMCTFLALNTGSVQLLPISAIAVLAAAGSREPTAIVGTTLLATACSSLAGLVVVKALGRLPLFRLKPIESSPPVEPATPRDIAKPEAAIPLPEPPRAAGLANVATLVLLILFAWLAYRLSLPAPAAGTAGDPATVRWIRSVSLLSVPFLLTLFPLYAALRGVSVYEQFIEGAKDGFNTAIRIIPYLVAILVAAGYFRGAGGIEILGRVTALPLSWLQFPPELLPMSLMRPLSGSGTLGLFTELVQTHGPDSLLARMGGTLFGSTETTFYVLAVYFGSVGIRRTRHAVWAGLAADVAGAFAAVFACRWMFAG